MRLRSDRCVDGQRGRAKGNHRRVDDEDRAHEREERMLTGSIGDPSQSCRAQRDRTSDHEREEPPNATFCTHAAQIGSWCSYLKDQNVRRPIALVS